MFVKSRSIIRIGYAYASLITDKIAFYKNNLLLFYLVKIIRSSLTD